MSGRKKSETTPAHQSVRRSAFWFAHHERAPAGESPEYAYDERYCVAIIYPTASE